ncbi:MAG: sugar nucleotide-binding protein, partial [Gemmatimonadales bacterium]
MSPRPARALVIGASGFLGSRLLANAPRDIETTGTGWNHPVRPGPWRDALLDVTSPSSVRALIERERPGLVFYVAYDKARHDVTVDGARAAATAAASAGARFVLTSTDLVFDGQTGNYGDTMPANPIMPYGQLKLAAEIAARDSSNAAVILRMSLLWGESGITLRPAYECDNLTAAQPIDAYTDE